MSLLGAHLTLWIGRTVPKPAPVSLLENLDSIEVTHADEGRSGFQAVFRVGRGTADLLDYGALRDTLLRTGGRLLATVTFNAVPEVLMDGIITHQQLSPGDGSGQAILTVTGEDVSVMMDLEEKSVEHPAQNETAIASLIILQYARYGLVPKIVPPPSLDVPIPTERTPVQQETDLAYLRTMAARFGYVFYVTPGPAPLVNTAYWGPPVRTGLPQKALSVNMGPDTNVTGIDFQYDGQAATFLTGSLQDRTTGAGVPIQTFTTTRPPLVSQPAWLTQDGIRTHRVRDAGLNAVQALARAQGRTDASMDAVVTATGKLDAGRYEAVLKPRSLVGLRGAGYSYDGFYYVKNVTHSIRRGHYEQSFTLTREGLGALSPVVPA